MTRFRSRYLMGSCLLRFKTSDLRAAAGSCAVQPWPVVRLERPAKSLFKTEFYSRITQSRKRVYNFPGTFVIFLPPRSSFSDGLLADDQPSHGIPAWAPPFPNKLS